MMEIDAATLEAVSGELAIRKLVAQYADAVTNVNGHAWIATWAMDGSWTLGGNTSTGHETLLSTWQGLMGLFEKVIQLPQDGLIELDGDAGTGRWSMIELGRNGSGDPFFTLGTYHDVYRRETSGWRFAERSFEFVYTGPPDLTGAWLK
jgi:hypothetical protein